MSQTACRFVPDYRDQPEGSAFWRADTPEGVELVAGCFGIRTILRNQAKRMPVHVAWYAAIMFCFWLFTGASRPFQWTMLVVGVFVMIPAWWVIESVINGRRGLAVHVLRDALRIHRQHVLRWGRWQHWRREDLARVYVNWEGWIVLRAPNGKRVGKFGGAPNRVDMKWLAELIRGRLDLSE